AAATLCKGLGDPEQTRRRYLLADGAGDALGRVEKGVVPVAPARAKPTVETLANPVNSAEQDTALPKNVRLVFEFERRLEGAGGAERYGPGQGVVGRLPVDVVMNREAAIDPGAVDAAALLEEPPAG